MGDQPDPDVQAVHDAAAALLSSHGGGYHVSFWRGLIGQSRSEALESRVRPFVHSLKVLIYSPAAVSSEDVELIGKDVERVVKFLDEILDEPARVGFENEDTDWLPPAIYMIRRRYEAIYQRSAPAKPL